MSKIDILFDLFIIWLIEVESYRFWFYEAQTLFFAAYFTTTKKKLNNIITWCCI